MELSTSWFLDVQLRWESPWLSTSVICGIRGAADGSGPPDISISGELSSENSSEPLHRVPDLMT
jgi:hypothetical protein